MQKQSKENYPKEPNGEREAIQCNGCGRMTLPDKIDGLKKFEKEIYAYYH
jgi:hypothetical protein